MTPQQFFEALENAKEMQKSISEKITNLVETFLQQDGVELNLEYPIIVEGKQKWMRVEEAKGQWVVNRDYVVETRAKPQNPA